jgi:hypothetical protein
MDTEHRTLKVLNREMSASGKSSRTLVKQERMHAYGSIVQESATTIE